MTQYERGWLDAERAYTEEIKRLQGLLSGRVGKLLDKGKPFIVVANDESYFTAVYLVIRESETAKGTWTEQCEECFQELTHYDNGGYFPMPTPELDAVLRDQVAMNKLQARLTRLRKRLTQAAAEAAGDE